MDELIARLDVVLRNYRPEYYHRLLPGLTVTEIRATEESLGFSFPRVLKNLYLWKNGQPALYFEPLFQNRTFESIQQVVESHRVLTELEQCGEFDTLNGWSRKWIPFLANGAGDYHCVDMEGVFTGQQGQIIEFWHDIPSRTILAPSLESWLASFVHMLENEDWDEYKRCKETGEDFFIDWQPDIPGYPVRAWAG